MADSPADAEDFFEFANQFLNENTHLFTILGIFGAIAVYLGTITTGLSTRYVDVALDIGVFSSLSLFILVGAMICRKYHRKYSEFSDLPMFYPSKENVVPGLISGLSLVFFVALIGAVSVMVIVTLWESWSRFFRIIGPLLLFYALITVNVYVPHIIRESDQLSWIPYLAAIFLLGGSIFFFVSVIYVLFVDVSDDVRQMLTLAVLVASSVYLVIFWFLIPTSYTDVD